MISLVGIAVFSGLAMNLLLQFALGITGAAKDTVRITETSLSVPLIQLAILFFSSIFLWVFFAYLMPNYWKGFSELFLFFPLSALMCIGLEYLGERIIARFFSKYEGIKKVFPAFTAYDGLIPAALIITFLAAENFLSALVLALFFAIGNLTAMLVLNEIRRKSTLEWIPNYLRGTPLIIVSMGLLSIISVSVAGICLKVLGIF